jgi:GNAT superfamily N-acetyltransferase
VVRARESGLEPSRGYNAMTIRSEPVTLETLRNYASISIAFEVRGRLDPLTFLETPVESWIKDYDAIEGNHPTDWAAHFDVSNWTLLTAWQEDERVGGAVVAWNSEGLGMLQGRKDLAVLWDIRVAEGHRGQGIGQSLFRTALDWARARGCVELQVETQDINPNACRFYSARGCTLLKIDPDAYPGLAETQLIWSIPL